MIQKLRLKFIFVNMGIVTLMLIAILAVILGTTQYQMEQEALRTMRNLAREPFVLNQPTDPDRERRIPFFALEMDEKGQVLEAYGDAFDLSDTQSLTDLALSVTRSGETWTHLPEYGLRCLYTVQEDGSHLAVFVDTAIEDVTLRGLLRTCLLIGGAAFVGFLAISIALAYWAVRPVEIAMQQQKQFISDASHELKTPLTVMITNAELILQDDTDSATRRRLTENSLTMAQRMKELTVAMLDLARADSGRRQPVLSRIDLSEAVEETSLAFEAVFFEKGLQLQSRIAPGVFVKGDRTRLIQAVEILLDNAARYTAGDTVTVTLERQRGLCLVSVEDEGEPIPEAERAQLFKRFYRRDPSRSQSAGYGLGLPIAAAIVSEHGGRIHVRSSGGLNRFTIELKTV